MPSFKVFDTSVAETSSDSIATIKIKLSYRPTVRATVDWTTVDDTATAGEDYVARSGTAHFPRGVRTKYIKVKVLPDTLNEGDEGFGVQLSDAWHAGISHSYGYVTILDDDEEPSVSTEDVDVTEGDAGATDVELPVWLSEESGRTVTVGYTVTPGTATHDQDYSISPTSGTLVFLPGETEESVTVSVLGDKVDEVDETVNFSLVQPVNAWIDNGEAALTIVDDDSPGISVNDVNVTEGGNAVFTVSLSAASPQQVTVDYATKNGTATQPADYTAKSGTLTFAPGEKIKQVSVPTAADTADEADETFSLMLSHATNSVISDADGVATILDNDGPSLSVEDTWTTEGRDMLFTVKLSSKSPQQVTVAYATANGTATQPGDYLAKSGTLTFAPGHTSETIAVPTVDDTTPEIDEQLLLNLSGPTQATIADGQAVGTIADNDGLRLAVGDLTVTEGNSATFHVTLSTPSSETVTVDYVTKDGTAKAPGDYTMKSATLTFAPDQTSKVVSVPTVDDAIDEPDETFSLVLSDPVNASIQDATGVATIVDNDQPGPSLRVSDAASAPEGSDITFTVSLSAQSAQQVTVKYRTQDGTAKAPGDYTAKSDTLTFAPGQTSKSVSISTVADTAEEEDESFTLLLTDPVNAPIGDAVGQTWIDGNGTIAKATDLGGIDGDTGTDVVTEDGTVWFADHDVYSFKVWESVEGPANLSLTVRLAVPDNGGNLDLCLYDGTGQRISCKTTAGTADEVLTVGWSDTIGTVDTKQFYVEVLGGTADAMNSYRLTLTR